jgi:hypothetical protein
VLLLELPHADIAVMTVATITNGVQARTRDLMANMGDILSCAIRLGAGSAALG